MHIESFLNFGIHDFHRIVYYEWGASENDRILACVHGMTRNGRDFDYLAEALSDTYRVVCPDLPGRGESEWLKFKEDYDYPLYCAAMSALLVRLHCEEVDWVGTSMGGMIGIILAAAVLIGATNIEIRKASSLRQKSEWTRDLAAVINLNTPADGPLFNFRLPAIEEPQTAIFFYGDRWLAPPVTGEEELMRQVREFPKRTWLTRIQEFKSLQQKYPDELYLIQGNPKYAYFTSMAHRDKIQYDFSQEGLTYHR